MGRNFCRILSMRQNLAAVACDLLMASAENAQVRGATSFRSNGDAIDNWHWLYDRRLNHCVEYTLANPPKQDDSKMVRI